MLELCKRPLFPVGMNLGILGVRSICWRYGTQQRQWGALADACKGKTRYETLATFGAKRPSDYPNEE